MLSGCLLSARKRFTFTVILFQLAVNDNENIPFTSPGSLIGKLHPGRPKSQDCNFYFPIPNNAATNIKAMQLEIFLTNVIHSAAEVRR